MNTLFSFAPFRRFDLGSHVRLTAGGSPYLGQGVFSTLLKDIGLSSDIESLIAGLPEAEKSFNRDRWNECQKMGLTTVKGAACALGVIEDIKAGKTSAATATPTKPATAPSGFPIVPVVIGLAAAGGAVWYFASR